MKTFNEIYQNWMDGNIAAAKQAVEELNKMNTVTRKQHFSIITTENLSVSPIPTGKSIGFITYGQLERQKCRR